MQSVLLRNRITVPCGNCTQSRTLNSGASFIIYANCPPNFTPALDQKYMSARKRRPLLLRIANALLHIGEMRLRQAALVLVASSSATRNAREDAKRKNAPAPTANISPSGSELCRIKLSPVIRLCRGWRMAPRRGWGCGGCRLELQRYTFGSVLQAHYGLKR